MIDKEEQLSVTRQCEILNLNRSGVYYKLVLIRESERDLTRQVDEIHLNYPFYGSRNIRNELCLRGYPVGRDWVRIPI
jgi:putative transposase